MVIDHKHIHKYSFLIVLYYDAAWQSSTYLRYLPQMIGKLQQIRYTKSEQKTEPHTPRQIQHPENKNIKMSMILRSQKQK